MAAESEVKLGSTPFKWSGLEEEFAEWKFEMEQWVRRHHTDMPTLTARSAEAAAPLAAGDMTAETIELSGKLMTDLAMKTTGKAKR